MGMRQQPFRHAQANLKDFHIHRFRHVIIGPAIERLVDHVDTFVGRHDDDVGHDVRRGAVALAEFAA
jgi:hypothetical protein